jgi:hypothetical protein
MKCPESRISHEHTLKQIGSDERTESILHHYQCLPAASKPKKYLKYISKLPQSYPLSLVQTLLLFHMIVKVEDNPPYIGDRQAVRLII